MKFGFHTLDVFTDQRFGGNPLAVVLNAGDLTGEQMQIVAREFNLSETVFVMPPADAANTAAVRIFTPAREMPFAGHPTIGTAILLAEAIGGNEVDIRLEEKVGLVPVKVTRGEAAAHAVLSGAVMPTVAAEGPEREDVAAAIGLTEGDIGFDGHRPLVCEAGNSFLFVPVAGRAALARAMCDMGSWKRLGGAASVGVYVYCAGTDTADFHSRLFAPEAGIIEDPATGSAAATFPAAIMAGEALSDGSHAWNVAQGEDMGRPSHLEIAAEIADGAFTSVTVGGRAVMISEGTITV